MQLQFALVQAPSRNDRTSVQDRPGAVQSDRRRHRRQRREGAGRARRRRRADGADLLVLPELFISGYPPEDLVLKPAFQAACRAAVEDAGARHRRRRSGGADRHALGRGRQALQCRARCSTAARSPPCASRSTCRTTACSTRSASSRAARCRGPVNFPRRPARRSRSARTSGEESEARERRRMPRRDRRGNPARAERLALLPRQDRRAATGRGRPRHRERPAAGLSSTRSAARTNWSSTARRSRCNADKLAGVPDAGFEESVVTDAWLARDRRRTGAASRADGAARSRSDEADYRACVLGLRDYVEQERLQGRRARPLRRHRFGDLRGDGGRCAGRGAGARRDDALSLHVAGFARRRRACARRSACRYDIVPIVAPVEGFRDVAEPLFEGCQARHHRGEPAEPRARHDPDGDLQQVRLDGGDHRQQVGNVGRLRHALWRHERRLQPDQGPLQDAGLPALALAQHAGSRRARSGRPAR